MDQSLISDDQEVLTLFDHLLENNKFDKEFKNLLIYKKYHLIFLIKKALVTRAFVNEFYEDYFNLRFASF